MGAKIRKPVRSKTSKKKQTEFKNLERHWEFAR